jgi:hypothetical protein
LFWKYVTWSLFPRITCIWHHRWVIMIRFAKNCKVFIIIGESRGGPAPSPFLS